MKEQDNMQSASISLGGQGNSPVSREDGGRRPRTGNFRGDEDGGRNQKGHEGTLTTFGFALAPPARVKRWTLASLRSGLTFRTWLNVSSPGTIFCECPVRVRSFVRTHEGICCRKKDEFKI